MRIRITRQMRIVEWIVNLMVLPYTLQYERNRANLENEARRQLEIEKIKEEMKLKDAKRGKDE